MPYNYNVNPPPRTGQGAYGMVPGQIQLPTPAADLSRQYPNLARTNAAMSDDILAGLEGQLAPGTMRDLQDFNASWGVASGMPGSGLATNRLGRNIGLAAEQLKNTAIGQYNSTIPTITGTQTVNPALQTEIATQNSLNNAAPDPTAAASHAESLFQQYLQRMAGPAGGLNRVNQGGGGSSRPWWQSPNPTSEPYSEPGMMVARSNSNATMYGGKPYYDGQTPDAGFSYSAGAGGDLGITDEELSSVGLTPEDLGYFN